MSASSNRAGPCAKCGGLAACWCADSPLASARERRKQPRNQERREFHLITPDGRGKDAKRRMLNEDRAAVRAAYAAALVEKVSGMRKDTTPVAAAIRLGREGYNKALDDLLPLLRGAANDSTERTQ